MAEKLNCLICDETIPIKNVVFCDYSKLIVNLILKDLKMLK